ncbi:MAG TPA: preprotein translocase subunit Sec61beta [Thermoprotei archaeon]|nr:preprotein translocase subunit Sec61beta [Thermoprotei archaeon]
MTGAGLVRFFEEDIRGIKIKPHFVIVSAMLLITIVLLAHLGLFTP